MDLRKRVYLLDLWFITKGYNSRTARWKRCLGKDTGKVGGAVQIFTALSRFITFQALHVFTHLEALQILRLGFSKGFIM